MTVERAGELEFQAHVALLRKFLAQRDAIVERIQGVLHAQRRLSQYLQDRGRLARDFEDCFFAFAGAQAPLRGQLEVAHWASGFRPRQMAGMHNDVVDPVEMLLRGFHFWQQTRWPGRNGRARYAQTLFNLSVLRALELLSMRLWDTGPAGAGERLGELQQVLDGLWHGTPADQPIFLRDARWLIPLALSPTTDDLTGYFVVAERVAESLPPADRLEAQRASVCMIGGHLRSQIRHYCLRDGVSIDDRKLILRTRRSNALDFALLIQGLVHLLDAYEQALVGGDEPRRLELAGAICQAISADPEVFVDRVELLGPCSMIEHLFVAADGDGQAAYTPMGERHSRLVERYRAQIGRLAQILHADCEHFRPAVGRYSPYGAIFGTPSHLTELIALKVLQPGAEMRFGLEDVFADREPDADRLAWVDRWRKLPHIERAVQQMYDYPQQFAEEVFARIERALSTRAARGDADAAGQTGRLVIAAADTVQSRPSAAAPPAVMAAAVLPARFVVSSDAEIVAAGIAEACDEAQLLRERQEGEFAVSFQTRGGWVGVSKDIVTEILGAGQDVEIDWLPRAAAGVLRLMCAGFVAAADLPPASAAQASVPPSIVKA